MKRILVAMLAISMCVAAAACSQKKSEPAPAAETVETTDVAEPAKETTEEVDGTASASTAASAEGENEDIDAMTSASIVPKDVVSKYEPKGFTDSDSKKALFVVGDPRKNSVNYDLAYTAMKHFEENGVEVELRDLYDMSFNPVLSLENFFYAKDGFGEPTPEIKTEQDFVTKADYIIFVYPNWHDTPTSIVKGYMETVFAKQYAYENTADGLAGKLTGKSIFTIMNAGFLGGGRGYIGDGVGIDDESWDKYMNGFKIFDDDTAGFWGVENYGRFVNDRTPKNNSENYAEEIAQLRSDLTAHLDKVFFAK